MVYCFHKWLLLLLMLAAGISAQGQLGAITNTYGDRMKPLNMDAIMDSIGYPVMAQLARAEGTVTLQVLVSPYGKYLDHKVVHNPHSTLTCAVEKQVRKLDFPDYPGQVDWKNPNIWVTVDFAFRLADVKTPLRRVPETDRVVMVKAICHGGPSSYSGRGPSGSDGCKTKSGPGAADQDALRVALEARPLPDFPGDTLNVELEIVIAADGVAADIVPVGLEHTALGQAIQEALLPLRWIPMKICFVPMQSTYHPRFTFVKQ